jgi:hypothetical protein
MRDACIRRLAPLGAGNLGPPLGWRDSNLGLQRELEGGSDQGGERAHEDAGTGRSRPLPC